MTIVRPGSIIAGSRWPEPVEVKFIEELGGYVHIVGATTKSGSHIDQIIPTIDFYDFRPGIDRHPEPGAKPPSGR